MATTFWAVYTQVMNTLLAPLQYTVTKHNMETKTAKALRTQD